MTRYTVPQSINYIAAFLTFGCQLHCSYCINRAGKLRNAKMVDWRVWRDGLSRFVTRPDLPITLQGGEPTTYKGFYPLVRALPERLQLDLLTNCQFNVDEFVRQVDPGNFSRVAKYAPIRVSFHAETMEPLDTVARVMALQAAGFKVGVWAVDIENWRKQNEHMKELCEVNRIDFRWKEYLAPGHGTYRYPDAVNQKKLRKCLCKTSEILISPSGHFHRCHADLYSNRNHIGHMLDKTLPNFTETRPCHQYGACNYCDVKNKFNRFQEPNNCSVEITNIC